MAIRETTYGSPQGLVEFVSQVSPGDLVGYALDPGIGTFAGYRSIISSKEGLAQEASREGTNLCLALAGGDIVVSYGILRLPPAGERWAEMRPPVLLELMSENARGWRGIGLQRLMLKVLVERPENDARIIFIVGYSWTWDLDGTQKDLSAYRNTIIHLLTPLGFKQFPTNEPNVSLRPENLFMARIGKKIDSATRKNFTNILFGMNG